ncbi:MAG: bile acid:sodium symporter family protein, partial [Limnobacter sp.]
MLGNTYITIGLPVSLFIIMIGMGLSLTVEDFRRIKEQPKGVIVGTVLQLLGVPLLGFAIG